MTQPAPTAALRSDGFGRVEPEAGEPVFHENWEGRVLAMNRAIGASGVWNIDEGRFGIERLEPQIYLASSYYGKWFLRLEHMLKSSMGSLARMKLPADMRSAPAKPCRAARSPLPMSSAS